MCGQCELWLPRMKEEGIKPVSLTIGPVNGAYSVYAYKALHVTFDDGRSFSTSRWMYPTSPKSIKHLEEAFGLKLHKEPE